MTAKEAFEKLRIGKYDTIEEKVKYQIKVETALNRLPELETENVLLRQNNHSLEELMKRPELELVRENIRIKQDNDLLLMNECSARQENKKLEEVLKIIREDFEVTDFDEFLPKNSYYESKEKQNLIKEYLK